MVVGRMISLVAVYMRHALTLEPREYNHSQQYSQFGGSDSNFPALLLVNFHAPHQDWADLFDDLPLHPAA